MLINAIFLNRATSLPTNFTTFKERIKFKKEIIFVASYQQKRVFVIIKYGYVSISRMLTLRP